MKGKGKGVFVNMRRDAQPSATVVAKLEPGVMVNIGECNGDWCFAKTDGAEGWVAQSKSGAPIPAKPSSKAGLLAGLRQATSSAAARSAG